MDQIDKLGSVFYDCIFSVQKLHCGRIISSLSLYFCIAYKNVVVWWLSGKNTSDRGTYASVCLVNAVKYTERILELSKWLPTSESFLKEIFYERMSYQNFLQKRIKNKRFAHKFTILAGMYFGTLIKRTVASLIAE